MSNTFFDKPLVNLKQVASIVGTTILLTGGVIRFETKTNDIEFKLDKVIALYDTISHKNTVKFSEIDRRLLTNENDLKSVTTSLTAIIMLKPEDVQITQHR